MTYKIITCLLFISVLCAGCLSGPEHKTESVNCTYDVRDVHFGYVNGASIIVVEYYDGNTIKMVDNKMSTTVTRFRFNIIDIERSKSNVSTLLQYEKSTRYPNGRYILYLADSDDISGIGSNHPHSRKADEETYIN